MIEYRAAWVLPISAPPIRDGWVVVDRQRIVAIGKRRGGASASSAAHTIDLGDCAILPGLVNAHTHLELSWMRGRIGPCDRFTDWVKALIALRRRIPDPGDKRIMDAAIEAIDEAAASGTAVVGDISNTLMTIGPLAAGRLAAVVFHELIGFNPDDPAAVVQRAREQIGSLPEHETLRVALAPHAPYSVAPWLFRAIRDDLDAHPFARTSVHLGESREEVEFLQTGLGPWRTLLEDLHAWNPRWAPPCCAPLVYLDRLGFLDERVILVHGVHLSAAELRRLAQLNATLVTCPRGNVRTGAGRPPIQACLEAGVRLALGTDSLASVDDLNLFSELAALRALAPGVPAARLLESATKNGADALGYAGEFGAIEPGYRARLLAVSVPNGEADVEEYLLRGIGPGQIQWLDARVDAR